jgi:hypothetical protein
VLILKELNGMVAKTVSLLESIFTRMCESKRLRQEDVLLLCAIQAEEGKIENGEEEVVSEYDMRSPSAESVKMCNVISRIGDCALHMNNFAGQYTPGGVRGSRKNEGEESRGSQEKFALLKFRGAAP